MNKNVREKLEELFVRYPMLKICQKDIEKAYEILVRAYDDGNKLLIAGNGGSAADSEHIAGELMKRFRVARPISASLSKKLISIDEKIGKKLSKNLEMPLRAVPLTSHIAITTAYMNDADATGVFAQQLLGYGEKGDVFLAISTSGNSENIISACVVAKAMGIKIIGLSGIRESRLKKMADVCIMVPETETYRIQELHLPVYHALCMMLECNYYGDNK